MPITSREKKAEMNTNSQVVGKKERKKTMLSLAGTARITHKLRRSGSNKKGCSL